MKLVIHPEGIAVRALSILTVSVMVILVFADNAFAFDDAKYKAVCKAAMDYIEGDFGALLTAVAGTGAIVASAIGGFKTAWSLLVVAVGAFILRNFIIGQDGVGLGLFNAGAC